MGLFDRLKHVRRPRCPVTPDDRLWIENSFAWFGEEFGGEIVRSGPTILPTPEFFPEVYEPGYEAAADLLERLCRWMDIDRSSIMLDFFDEGEAPDYGLGAFRTSGPAGLMNWDEATRRWVVAIGEQELADPMTVVAILAHELAHVHLFGFGRVDPRSEEDHEPLTDLLAIYFGLGVFVGNAAFTSEHRDNGSTSTWSARRLGYLPEPMIGFALALTVIAKDQKSVDWVEYLAYGVRKPFEEGLAFLLDERRRELDSLLG